MNFVKFWPIGLILFLFGCKNPPSTPVTPGLPSSSGGSSRNSTTLGTSSSEIKLPFDKQDSAKDEGPGYKRFMEKDPSDLNYYSTPSNSERFGSTSSSRDAKSTSTSPYSNPYSTPSYGTPAPGTVPGTSPVGGTTPSGGNPYGTGGTTGTSPYSGVTGGR